MASFDGNIGTPNGGFNLKVEYEYYQDIASNKTVISSLKGFCKRNNSTYRPFNDNCFAEIKTDGNLQSRHTGRYDLRTNDYVQIVQATGIEIHHNDVGDGGATISFSFDGKLSSYYPNGSVSQWVSFPRIPRKVSLSVSNANPTFGDNITVYLNKPSNSYRCNLWCSLEGETVGVVVDATSSNVLNIPLSLMNAIKNSISGKATVGCDVYLNENPTPTWGLGNSMDITINVPQSAAPTMDMPKTRPLNDGWGEYLQGQSACEIVFNNVKFQYGAGWGTRREDAIVSCNGVDYVDYKWMEGANYRYIVVPANGLKVGKNTITATVGDTRGLKVSKSVDIEVEPYFKPYLTNVSCSRYEKVVKDGVATYVKSDEGTYLGVYATGNFADVSKQKEPSKCKITVAYKKKGVSSYNNEIQIESNKFTFIGDGTIAVNSAYDVKFKIWDAFVTEDNASSIVQNIGTSIVGFNFTNFGKGGAVGTYAEDGCFKIRDEWDMKYKDNIITDFVIEKGEKGGWTYRKWYSGIVELFRRQIVMTNFTAAGGLYVSFHRETGLPFEFVDDELYCSATIHWSENFLWCNSWGNTSTVECHVFSPFNNNENIVIRWQITGKLKPNLV